MLVPFPTDESAALPWAVTKPMTWSVNASKVGALMKIEARGGRHRRRPRRGVLSSGARVHVRVQRAAGMKGGTNF